MKSFQIRSFLWSEFRSNTGKHGSEKTPHLDTFHVVERLKTFYEFVKWLLGPDALDASTKDRGILHMLPIDWKISHILQIDSGPFTMKKNAG